MRQSLRPLPQPPAMDASANHRMLRHERGQSVDLSRLSISHDHSMSGTPVSSIPRALPARPTSMLLARTDSINRGSAAIPHAHAPHYLHPLQVPQDLESLGRSSTNQLRTLSRLAQSETADEFSITAPAQEVVGLRGRRKLQRTSRKGNPRTGRTSGGYEWESRNWMDKQRQFLQAYEYLCRIGEAKEWIEDIIQKNLPPIVELEEALRDGVTLAEVVQSLNPNKRFRIFHHPRLQYRHSDNIAIFFRYLDEVELPDLFRFELIDLYEKKNIPKVIYCIHALSWLLFRNGIVDFRIGNLVGQLEFEHHELEAMQKGLDKLGANMPSFGNMGANFGVEEPPEPEETEEERIDRELGEQESSISDLQTQMRGALVRMRLGHTMQELWDWEDCLVDLQARIRGDWARQIIGYRMQMRRFATNLQTFARGFLVRARMRNRNRFWKRLEPGILELQCLIRARRIRNEVGQSRSHLLRCGASVRDFQAALRGYLVRQDVSSELRDISRVAAPVQHLQSAVRGCLLRMRLGAQKALLNSQSSTVAALQAAMRATLTRNQIHANRSALWRSAPDWILLQAFTRGKLLRSVLDATRVKIKQHEPEVVLLQSQIRAGVTRARIKRTLNALEADEASIRRLQAFSRAMIERFRIESDRQLLDRHVHAVKVLQGFIRGKLFRKQHQMLLSELDGQGMNVVLAQALARAVLARELVGKLLQELVAAEGSVIEFQATAKGFMKRQQFEEKKRYFDENMKKVIKIQSFVRAKIQGAAYKCVTAGRNPPVGAVKNFVHLLNDSDFDFNEEVEIERLRKTVVQQVRQNELLEQYIDQIDIKIALLVKNKITLDEVVRHQHNYGGHSVSLLANTSISSANQFDLKALNKGSRKKLESYQQLFFNLQTQPQYLARLFRRIREKGMADKDCKRIEHLIMSLFGYAQKRREEYYLLKLIARSIREEIEGSRSLHEYLRGNFFWCKLLGNYTRSPRDRKYLRELLGPLIRDNIIEDPALDLESDPMQIYRSAINNEELRTGRPSPRPLNVSREAAIRDPETRELFIDHLRDLREICDQFLVALDEVLPRMPYGLRYLCRQMFEALSHKFSREAPQKALIHMVSHWLWRFYLQPALTAPEHVGVIERHLSPLQKRNLGEVAKVINQVASGRHFGGDNVYLQPLNQFVSDSLERLEAMTTEIISVPDAERIFDIDEFNDLYAKNKPTLYIKMTDIFAIHSLVATELATICPGRDDVLREIMQDLGSAKNNESEMHAAGSSDIQLFLSPTLHDLEDPDAAVKALFLETKRSVLYIIRVQSGANLLEILVKPPTREDEAKWQALLREDFAAAAEGGVGTRGAYSEANMVDVTRLTFCDLKRAALENVMRLEQAGRISKLNFYQDILNAIAVDIRTKSRRRVQRQRELEGVRMTLANLNEKAVYLEQQRKSYDNYIEQAMATLQNKKGLVLFSLFSFIFTSICPSFSVPPFSFFISFEAPRPITAN